MTVVIARERFDTELFDEIVPLARKCWTESTLAKGETCAFYGEREFEIEPDFEGYQRFNAGGALVIITLRVDGELKGYVVGLTYRAMHHKKILGGIGDSIYIDPPYRSHTRTLIKRFEKELESMGVQIIGWPVTPDGPVHKILLKRGYVGDDIVMEKRICA